MKIFHVRFQSAAIIRLSAVSVIAVAALNACSYLKASPAKDSGFLPDAEKLAPLNERSPYNGVYYRDREKFYAMKSQFVHIFVAPVDTSFLAAKIMKSKHESETSKKEDVEDLQELARYLQERVKRALKKYPKAPFDVVEEPGPKTLVLELAISELKPTHQVINTISTVAGFIIPPAAALQFVTHGSIAIEAIVRDASTDEILVEFKDRQIDKAAPFTIKDFQEYAHAREAIDDWAETFAELAATPYSHRVSGPWPVTLVPF